MEQILLTQTFRIEGAGRQEELFLLTLVCIEMSKVLIFCLEEKLLKTKHT